MWFAVFTAGMFFPFYLAATGLLIPIGRVLTRHCAARPPAGAVLALMLGGGIGIVVFAAVTLRTSSPAFVT